MKIFLMNMLNCSMSRIYTPSTIEALESSPDGIQLIHHNIQRLLSKSTEIAQWLHVCQASPTILCCSETCHKNDSFMLAMNGFSKFYSPILCRPDNSNSILPGSCMFVSCCPIQSRLLSVIK